MMFLFENGLNAILSSIFCLGDNNKLLLIAPFSDFVNVNLKFWLLDSCSFDTYPIAEVKFWLDQNPNGEGDLFLHVLGSFMKSNECFYDLRVLLNSLYFFRYSW